METSKKMKDLFKPEDFLDTMVTLDYIPKCAAKIANKKLNKLIETWPEVYFNKDLTFVDKNPLSTKYEPGLHDSKARFAFLEEIVKEPCKKHSPISTFYDENEIRIIGPALCEHCGVELIADWKSK